MGIGDFFFPSPLPNPQGLWFMAFSLSLHNFHTTTTQLHFRPLHPQALRKALLLAGDVPTLASASLSDVEGLSPAEFWAVLGWARKADVAGSALARALLPPGGTSGTAAVPDLDAVWALPAQERAALAWVLLRGASGDAGAAGAAGAGAGAGAGQQQPWVWGPAAAQRLVRAFEARAVGAHRGAAAARQAEADLQRILQLERDLAEVDLLGDRWAGDCAFALVVLGYGLLRRAAGWF